MDGLIQGRQVFSPAGEPQGQQAIGPVERFLESGGILGGSDGRERFVGPLLGRLQMRVAEERGCGARRAHTADCSPESHKSNWKTASGRWAGGDGGHPSRHAQQRHVRINVLGPGFPCLVADVVGPRRAGQFGETDAQRDLPAVSVSGDFAAAVGQQTARPQWPRYNSARTAAGSYCSESAGPSLAAATSSSSP